MFTAQWKKDEPVVNHTLTVTGGTFAVKNGGIDVTDTLETSTDETSGKQTCLARVAAENVGEAGGKHHAEAIIHERPDCVLAGRTSTEIRPCDQHRALAVAVLVEHEIRIVAPS